MVPYIVAFVITLLLVHRDAKKSNNWLYYILAPLPLIMLVTFRDVNVGTDTKEYTNIYEYASDCSNIIMFLGYTRIEPLYAALTYFISALGLSVEFLFFICACLSIYPILIGARMIRNEVSQTYVIFLFCMMFFHYSMNITRQAIAMAFLFLSIIYMLKLQNVKSYCLIGLAFLFHYVAVVCIPLILLYQLRNSVSKWGLFSLIAISFGLGYFVMPYINLDAVVNQYETNYFSVGRGGMQTSYTIEMIFNLILVYTYAKSMCTKANAFLFKTSTLYVVVLNVLSILAPQVFRLALVMDVLSILYISMLMTNKTYSYEMKTIKSTYTIFAIIFWVFVFVLNHSGDTVPYTSIFLGI